MKIRHKRFDPKTTEPSRFSVFFSRDAFIITIGWHEFGVMSDNWYTNVWRLMYQRGAIEDAFHLYDWAIP